jgi:hypothetical protein
MADPRVKATAAELTNRYEILSDYVANSSSISPIKVQKQARALAERVHQAAPNPQSKEALAWRVKENKVEEFARWTYEMRGQQALSPGQIQTLKTKINALGEYFGQQRGSTTYGTDSWG